MTASLVRRLFGIFGLFGGVTIKAEKISGVFEQSLKTNKMGIWCDKHSRACNLLRNMDWVVMGILMLVVLYAGFFGEGNDRKNM